MLISAVFIIDGFRNKRQWRGQQNLRYLRHLLGRCFAPRTHFFNGFLQFLMN